MKKFYVIGAFVAALSMFVACNKENSVIENPSGPVSIVATYEQPEMDADTKVAISEGATNFVLNWDGTETMKLGNSGDNNTTSDFSASSPSGTSITFTGTGLPSGVSGTTNYMGVVASWSSFSNTTARGTIKDVQVCDGTTSIGNSALLVAREDNCTVGELSSLSFKTMNAFLKFSLKKGAAAVGSSNDYSSGMLVTSIVVEAIGDEAIAGRFGFSKTDADWTAAYAEEIVGQVSSSVTLDCTNGGANDGIALDSGTAKDFYVAIAYKTYSQGLKITINVKNPAGKAGKKIGYISKNASITIARNKMIRMPELTVDPEDAVASITLWTENWNDGSDAQSPSDYQSTGTGTSVYGGGSVTYTQSSASDVRLYTGTMYAGGSEPELYIKKSSGTVTWTVSGIPTAGASKLLLTFGSNNGSAVTSPTTGVTLDPASGAAKSFVINVPAETPTITLVFGSASSSKNTRIDDIVLKTKVD